MNILLTCPAPPHSRKGNRVTAVRWAGLLRSLGHRVAIVEGWHGQSADLLIALHARKSHPALSAFRQAHPDRPTILCLTGTDLYDDIPQGNSQALQSLELADRIVILQPQARLSLPSDVQKRTEVIFQSVPPLKNSPTRNRKWFDICVLGHLRQVKDPLRAGLALELLPKDTNLRVLQAGQALESTYADQAHALMEREPRYRWLGEISSGKARQLLSRSHLMVISSILEGGANVVSEAIVLGTPVLASDIPGNLGLLGSDYPGTFPVGDTQALADLMLRAKTDSKFYADLSQRCDRLRPLFTADRERSAWERLLKELTPG